MLTLMYGATQFANQLTISRCNFLGYIFYFPDKLQTVTALYFE